MSLLPGRFTPAFFGCAGPRLTGDEVRFFRDAAPLGFILFARNIEDAAQLSALTAALRDSVGWNAPILIDQEGGRVQRLRPPLARDWAPPLDFIARSGSSAARAMYLRARLIADDLMRYGIDVNCIPTLDVARDGTHPFLRNRCYGTDVASVTVAGQATVQGLLDGGVLPVMKHMPGHGLAQLDTHYDLPLISEKRELLEGIDFKVFSAFSNLRLGMSAHLVFQAYDDRPATTSDRMIDLIRTRIGFDGLLMTDDISMEALQGTVPERAAASLAAGCDAVLHCNGDLAEMVALAAACPDMPQGLMRRATDAFGTRPAPQPIDIPAAEAELADLTG